MPPIQLLYWVTAKPDNAVNQKGFEERYIPVTFGWLSSRSHWEDNKVSLYKENGQLEDKICSKPLTLSIKLWRVTRPAPFVQETWTVSHIVWIDERCAIRVFGLANNKIGDKKVLQTLKQSISYRISKQPYSYSVHSITQLIITTLHCNNKHKHDYPSN